MESPNGIYVIYLVFTRCSTGSCSLRRNFHVCSGNRQKTAKNQTQTLTAGFGSKDVDSKMAATNAAPHDRASRPPLDSLHSETVHAILLRMPSGSSTITDARRRPPRGRRRWAGLIAAALLFGLGGCDSFPLRNDLEVIRSRGVLRVITRNNGTCYYEGAHRKEGFEHDLVAAFARHLQVTLQLQVMENDGEMIASLMKGEADLIAAGFAVTAELQPHLEFGPAYHEVQLLVVGRRDAPAMPSPADLNGTPLWARPGVFHENPLRELKQQYPDLTWLTLSGYESEEMLEMVSHGLIPLTISDSDTVAINRRYHPDLAVHFAIDDSRPLAWVVQPQAPHLRNRLHQWFAMPATKTLLERLKAHYYGHLRRFDYVDIKAFRQRIGARLPRFRRYFQNAAAENGLDWKLIAAQAYQESHWDPQARSFTGVRGLMMLTRDTARELGVSDRTDPEQSIFGGAEYLARLYRRLGDGVADPDRTFMALAAYNVGWGHLRDARLLAKSLHRDPNSWADVRRTLPLLRLKKHYRHLDHGYARGLEPVRYVDRIRTYYKVLQKWESPASR